METLIEVNKKDENGILIFSFSGELDETNADKTFTSIINDIGSFEDKKIIFDFTNLKYLNSKSIGYIADIYSQTEDASADMYIANCDDGVKDVLELVGITTIVPTVDTVHEAVQALS